MSEVGFTYEWPLWGMSLGEPAPSLTTSLRLHDSLLYQPTWAQWAEMEARAVVEEYCQQLVVLEQMGQEVGRLPPPCLLRISESDSEGESDPSEFEHEAVVRAVVSALRVYDGGDFVDPQETGTYAAHPGGLVVRRVSVFRCALYGWTPSAPYLLLADDVADVETIASSCWAVLQDPAHRNAGLALENFVLSFGFVTPPAEAALHRFIALESLFGGMRDSSHGAPFEVRVANTTSEHAPTVREWLTTMTELRNTLAHRSLGVVPDPDDLEMLEHVVRSSLVAYFNHLETTEDATLSSFNQALAAGPVPEVP